MDNNQFVPSDFMRARHPELYSDTTLRDKSFLTESLLEYHLDTLTSRKQENDFENFCRRLAEKEICPNLLPQSGPVGGGDSKVDSENYPVADTIIDGWYEGIPRKAGTDKWAFAFSAKQKWRDKVNSDVKKITKLQRNYDLIYFFTNQFVPDKKRAEVEQNLMNSYGTEVRILDRTWLVRRVIDYDYEELAIETLHIHVPVKPEIRLGPIDVSREAELSTLEEKFRQPEKYYRANFQLVEDYIHAAKLSRGMAHPQHRVFGYLAQAKRLAYQVNNAQQIINVIYNEAWTAFWWFNDIGELDRRYDEIEPLCLNSIYISDLESLHNLWMVMHSSARMGLLTIETEKLNKRTTNLLQALERLGANDVKPNSALHARTLIHLAKLNLGIDNPEIIPEELNNLHKCFKKVEGLASYPIFSFVESLTEIGNALSNYTEYDDLMDTLGQLAAEREGEAQEGRLLFRRGIQKFNNHKYIDALRLLGQARERFIKDETQGEMIRTSMVCGMVYEAMGLLWAARMEMVFAASVALNRVDSHGIIPSIALPCTQRMVWLELQLGRIPFVLEWYRLNVTLGEILELEDEERAEFEDQRQIQDAVLGILMLKLGLDELKYLETLPAVFDELFLYSSRAALLYSLGYENVLREEGLFTLNDTEKDFLNFFMHLRDQPASSDLPDKPILHSQQQTLYTTILMGCQIELYVQNTLNCLTLAENILGVLESFLATVEYSDMVFFRPKLQVTVKQSEFATFPGRVWIDESGTQKSIEVRIDTYLSTEI